MSRHQNSRGYNSKQSQFVYVAKTTEEETVTETNEKPHYNNDKPQNKQYDDQRQ